MIFTNLDALVPFARNRAGRLGPYDGRDTAANRRLIRLCTHFYRSRSADKAATLILTRDIGHHSGGWWANPDYERCWHLSLSARDPESWQVAPRATAFFEHLARAFFGEDSRLLWIEGPWSFEGRAADVWHYRLFCDPAWAPIKPRGEVYTRALTEAGWKSFSDIHGYSAKDSSVDALFLQEGTDVR